MDSNFHAVTTSSSLNPGGLTGSPLLHRDAPLPMFTLSEAQTEDGHAMMEGDTFHSFRNLSHAVRGRRNRWKWNRSKAQWCRGKWQEIRLSKSYSLMDLGQDTLFSS